jgi:chemotaxis signal transduction protein
MDDHRMTTAFRSTAAFAARTRSAAPAVERATFVTFSLGGRRFAVPVEAVERVLQTFGADMRKRTHVSHAGVDVPLADLALGLGLAGTPSDTSRVLVLNLPTGWLAAVVDEVHDVAVVDAAMISLAGRRNVTEESERVGDAGLPTGVQGMFVQRDHETLVLDVGRALGFRFT